MPAAKYVIATDLSNASRRGAAFAAQLAKKTGAALDFLCAVPRDATLGSDDFLDHARNGVTELARKYAKDGFETSCHVTVGADAANSIVRHSKRVGADLIVVAPQGLSGWKKLVLGSVTDKVLRKAPSMMLISRGAGKRPPKRVLIAVDRSKGAARALRIGLDLARSLGARATVFHVIKPPSGFIHAVELMTENWWEFERKRVKEAHGEFDEWVAKFLDGGDDLDVVTKVAEGNAPEEILNEIQSSGAPLVVMGTHGKSRAEEFFVGSVARAVATVSPASVLLVRARPPSRKRKK